MCILLRSLVWGGGGDLIGELKMKLDHLGEISNLGTEIALPQGPWKLFTHHAQIYSQSSLQ